MAEYSIGWDTNTNGDGSALYVSSKMRKKEGAIAGSTGRHYSSTGNLTLASISGGATLQVGQGTAMLNGYFYVSDNVVTMSMTLLANGTYYVVLVLNDTGANINVTLASGGATTIAQSTVRVALCTSAQLTAIGASKYLTLGTIVITSGVITTLTDSYNWAEVNAFVPTHSVSLSSYSPTPSIANNSAVGLTDWVTSSISSPIYSYSAGTITINKAGVYLAEVMVRWDLNTTGSRMLYLDGTDVQATVALASSMVYATTIQPQRHVQIINVASTASIIATVQQNSGAARTLYPQYFKVVRL